MAQEGAAGPKWVRNLLLSIVLLVAFAIVGWSCYSWYRFARFDQMFENMEDGTCNITSLTRFKRPLWPLKRLYAYPLLGTLGVPQYSWTEVPCEVSLTVADASGVEMKSARGLTLVYFTYWQDFLPDVIHDRCSFLVPKHVSPFACSFSLDTEGMVQSGVYVGSKADLPDYVMLFFMKAAGWSLCTLGPILILICCRAKGEVDRLRNSMTSAASAREVLLDSPESYHKLLLADSA